MMAAADSHGGHPRAGRRWAQLRPGDSQSRRRFKAFWAAGTFVVAALALGGCELTELTIAESEDVVIAETRLTVNLDSGAGASSLSVQAYLHRTLSDARADEVDGAVVRLLGPSGAVVQLAPVDSGGVCLTYEEEEPNEDVGSCYRAEVTPSPFAPLEVVELEVVLPGGGAIFGSSRIPGAFDFVGLTHEGGHCRLEPDTNYRFQWTEAEGTWSYLSDAWIKGLPEALAGRDVEAPDSVNLTGFGIGQEDTDVLFPGEYGLFDIADDVDAELLRIFDEGLPGGASAQIAFAATDRNWVNWIRGGNFNPSGIIRIPSVFGDGTGFFGTATQRRLNITAAPDGEGMPPLCGPAEAQAIRP